MNMSTIIRFAEDLTTAISIKAKPDQKNQLIILTCNDKEQYCKTSEARIQQSVEKCET